MYAFFVIEFSYADVVKRDEDFCDFFLNITLATTSGLHNTINFSNPQILKGGLKATDFLNLLSSPATVVLYYSSVYAVQADVVELAFLQKHTRLQAKPAMLPLHSDKLCRTSDNAGIHSLALNTSRSLSI